MKEPRDFYSGPRAKRGEVRFPIHVHLSMDDRDKLASLSHRWKLCASDVVRKLLSKAKA